MSWDLASPPKILGMFLAVASGRAYPRDATGYEYQPAPRSINTRERRKHRDCAHTSSGAQARRRHRYMMTGVS